MGGAQPLAVTMNDGVGILRRGRPRADRARRRAALRRPRDGVARRGPRAGPGRRKRRGEPLSIALHRQRRRDPSGARQARRPPRRRDRSDLGARHAERLHPGRAHAGEAAALRDSATPRRTSRARMRLDGAPRATPCSSSSDAGAVRLRLRQQHPRAGGARRRRDAFDIPGFVPAFIRPLFCEGRGPFRWVALSGDPEDIARTDRRGAARRSRTMTPLVRWITHGAGARALPGAAGADLLARLRRARTLGPSSTIWSSGRREGADRHRPRPSGLRLGRVAEPRDGSRCGTGATPSPTGPS